MYHTKDLKLNGNSSVLNALPSQTEIKFRSRQLRECYNWKILLWCINTRVIFVALRDGSSDVLERCSSVL